MSIRTNRYYLRVYCWGFDRIIQAIYVVVCICAKSNIGPKKWKKYLRKEDGRHDFQIDLGINIMKAGLEMDWTDEDERPDYMPQGAFTPCDCGECYFCLNGYTTGIAHAEDGKRKKRGPGRPPIDVHYAERGAVLQTNKCTEVKDRVKLRNNGKYCKMCYRKELVLNATCQVKLNATQMQSRCRSSYMGCPFCQEEICKSCWLEGYDKHK